MGDLLARFKDHLVTLGISDGTIRNYLSDLNHFQNWLTSAYPKHSFTDLNSEHPLAYRTYLVHELEAPISSVNRRLSSLRQFFTWAVSQKLLSDHPMQGLGNVSLNVTPANTVFNSKEHEQKEDILTKPVITLGTASSPQSRKWHLSLAAATFLLLIGLGVLGGLTYLFVKESEDFGRSILTRFNLSSQKLSLLDDSVQNLSFQNANMQNQIYEGSTLGEESIIITNQAEIYPALPGAGSVGIPSNRFSSLYLTGGSIDNRGNLRLNGSFSVMGSATFNSNVKILGSSETSFGSTILGLLTARGGIITNGASITAGSVSAGSIAGATLTTTGNTSIGGDLSVSGVSNLGDLVTTGQIKLVGTGIDRLLLQPASDPAALTKLVSIKSSAGLEKFSLTSDGYASLSGDLAVSGGDLTTTNTTFNLLNETATTINFGAGATDFLNIGSAAANVKITDAEWSVTGAGAATFTSVSTGSGPIAGGAGSFTTLSSTGNTALSSGAGSSFSFGNSTGTATLQSGASSSWVNTSGNLTISTLTSGTLFLTSAGALNLSAGATSTFTLPNVVNALNFDAGTISVDALNNRVGFGDSVPSTLLSLGGTGAAWGLTLGDDAADSVNLYRSAANTLKTDDDLVIGVTGNGKITVGVVDPYLIENTGSFQAALEFRTTATAGADDFIFTLGGAERARLTETGNLTIVGTLTAQSTGTSSFSGALDMQNNSILNIGNAGTDFVAATGALNLAGVLTANGGITLGSSQTFSATSGIISATGLSASTIGTTSANLTLSTTTSGTLALTSAGALNLSTGAASTFTLANVANALNFDADTLSIDALNNRVGVGTSGPAEKLEIENGNVLLDHSNLKLTPELSPGAPTVAINAVAGNLNGAYTYKITFVTTSGETQGGTTSASVSPVNQQVNLTAIPTGTAGFVTARKIYRTAAAGADGTQKLVTTIADNTTTTYTDNLADASLGATVSKTNSTANIQVTSVENLYLVAGTGKAVVVGDGTGKITAGTFDPVYKIDGVNYSTYAPSMLGVKEEITGDVTLAYDGANNNYTHTLNLANPPQGSDLWVFSRVSDPDVNLTTVLVSGNTSARVWYLKDAATRSITFFSDRATSVSYRLTSPRFDHLKWNTLSEDQTTNGLTPPSAQAPVNGEAGSLSVNTYFGAFSENFNTSGTVTAGDLLSVDPTSIGGKLTRAIGAYDAKLTGVATTDGPIATVTSAGRVQVKVSVENGNIASGDHLTSSATKPGYAMKATQAGRTIGVALQPLTGADGTILVSVTPSWFDPAAPIYNPNGTVAPTSSSTNATYDTLTATTANITNLNVGGIAIITDGSGNLKVNGNVIVTGKGTFAELRVNNLLTLMGGISAPNGLVVNLGLSKSFEIKSVSGETVAHISDEGVLITKSAQVSELKVSTGSAQPTTGITIFRAGGTSMLIETTKISASSKVIVTFKGNYAPATRYWTSDEVTGASFTLHLDQAPASDVSFNWWIVN